MINELWKHSSTAQELISEGRYEWLTSRVPFNGQWWVIGSQKLAQPSRRLKTPVGWAGRFSRLRGQRINVAPALFKERESLRANQQAPVVLAQEFRLPFKLFSR